MSSLEKQFNLGEMNPDQGGGILYCIRYSRERLEAHQAQVVDALNRRGATFMEYGEDISVSCEGEPNAHVLTLLEELTVINEALEYKNSLLGDAENIQNLRDHLFVLFYSFLKERNLASAYELVSIFIPMLIQDIRLADHQNGVLTKKDRLALDNLLAFAKSKIKLLNSGKIVTVG